MQEYEQVIQNFKNTENFFNPSQGKYLILPQGFGDYNCPILHCLARDNKRIFNKKLDTRKRKDSKELEIALNYLKNNKVETLEDFKEVKNILDFNYSSQIIFNNHFYKIYVMYLHFASIIYREINNRLIRINYTDSKTTHTQFTSTNYHYEIDELPIVFYHQTPTSETNIIKRMLGMNKQNVLAMLKFFTDNGFLNLWREYKYIIDWEKGEKLSDRRARTFTVSEQFLRKPTRFYVEHDGLIEKFNNAKNSELERILSGDEVIDFEGKILSDETIRSMKFPSTEEVMERAQEMVKNKEKDKHGRTYVWEIPSEWYDDNNGKTIEIQKNGKTVKYKQINKLKSDCPYVSIDSHIKQYIRTMNGDKVAIQRKKYTCNGRTYYDRFYSTLSLLPKWIRLMIEIDGEKIEEVDACSLHPRIVGKVFEQLSGLKRPDFLLGDVHTNLSKILGVDRKQAKLINLSYWNSKIAFDKDLKRYATISSKTNKQAFAAMDKFLIENNLELFKVLVYIKTEMKPIKGKDFSKHTNMSAILMDYENRIMQKTIEKCNFPVIYCYDSLAVAKSRASECTEIFNSVLHNFLK